MPICGISKKVDAIRHLYSEIVLRIPEVIVTHLGKDSSP